MESQGKLHPGTQEMKVRIETTLLKEAISDRERAEKILKRKLEELSNEAFKQSQASAMDQVLRIQWITSGYDEVVKAQAVLLRVTQRIQDLQVLLEVNEYGL